MTRVPRDFQLQDIEPALFYLATPHFHNRRQFRWLILQKREPMRFPSLLISSGCRLTRLCSSGFVEIEN